MKKIRLFPYLIGALITVEAVAFEECEMAIEVSKKFQKGLLSKEQANELLIDVFSDYTDPNGKLATLTHFIQKSTGIENPILNGTVEQRGWSGNEVYAIQSEEATEVQFFLKIIPTNSKEYLPEMFGLALMNEITSVESPKISACGQCILNEHRYFLVLETPVKGISIQQYLVNVGQHEIGSSRRSLALSELSEAVFACGAGLAKLHNHVPTKKETLPEDAEWAMKQDLKGALEELTFQPKEGIEIEKLQTYTQALLRKMKAEDQLIGLAYGDIKTVHTFYDKETKTVSLVNPARLYLSFDPKGQIRGLPTKDVCKYLLSLTLNRFHYFLNESSSVARKELLTEEEVKTVIQSFELGYVQGGGTLPSVIEKEYAFLQHDLFFIKNSRRPLPEPELTRVNDLVNISLENIKRQLAEYQR